MAIELINVRTYDATGAIDATLTPSIQLFDNADNSLDFSGTMTWNSTILQYQFSPNIDATKTYTCNVYFGASAFVRYTTFLVSQVTSGGGGGLTVDEHDHLMGLSQFSGGNIVDRTKNNKDLIDKIEEFEKIIKKIPCFDMKAFDTLMNEKIGTIKPVDLSGIQTTLSNLLLEITAQKNILIDAKNKEKEELIQEKNKLEVEKQAILDKFDNFNENLKEKDTLLSKKQYDIDEKSHKISELELQIQQIQFEKESEKNKAEETINELLELHKGEIEEKDVTEGLLVQAYIDKN